MTGLETIGSIGPQDKLSPCALINNWGNFESIKLSIYQGIEKTASEFALFESSTTQKCVKGNRFQP